MIQCVVEEVQRFVELNQQQEEDALNNGEANLKLLELAIDLVAQVLLFHVRACLARVISRQAVFRLHPPARAHTAASSTVRV